MYIIINSIYDQVKDEKGNDLEFFNYDAALDYAYASDDFSELMIITKREARNV